MATLSTFAPQETTIQGITVFEPTNLANPADRERLSASAIRAFVNIAEKWNLTEIQARELLGGVASSTWHAWRSKPKSKKLDQDTLMRISLAIGIYKALHLYFEDKWADQWVVLGNRDSMFQGQSPVEYMIREGQPGMVEVRRMLDAWRGGR